MKLDIKDFDSETAYHIMEKLCKEYSSRVSGSKKEHYAIKFLSKYFRKNTGSLPMIENFQTKYYNGKYASLQIFPSNTILEGKPVWMTSSTPSMGIEADVSYIRLSNVLDISKSDIANKIIILQMEDNYLDREVFNKIKMIFKYKPMGAVILSTYHDDVIRSDLIFTENSIFAKIPTMLLPQVEFKEYEKNEQIKGKLLIYGEVEHEAVSSNVSTIVQGITNDFILLCTHHDTVEYTQGARDSAAGIVLILELAKLISKQTPNFTYRFITFGGEKTGFLGVSELLKEYDPSRVLLCINFSFIDSLPGEVQSFVVGDKILFNMIKEVSKTCSFAASVKHNAPNNSNNMVFTNNNIPSLMLTIKGDKDESFHHTELDKIDTFTPESLEKIGEFVIRIINRLEEMEEIEFSNNIPNDLLKENEKFFDLLKNYQK